MPAEGKAFWISRHKNAVISTNQPFFLWSEFLGEAAFNQKTKCSCCRYFFGDVWLKKKKKKICHCTLWPSVKTFFLQFTVCWRGQPTTERKQSSRKWSAGLRKGTQSHGSGFSAALQESVCFTVWLSRVFNRLQRDIYFSSTAHQSTFLD